MSVYRILIAAVFLLFSTGCSTSDEHCSNLRNVANNPLLMGKIYEWVKFIRDNESILDELGSVAGPIYARQRSDWFGLPIEELGIIPRHLTFWFYGEASFPSSSQPKGAEFLFLGYGIRRYLAISLVPAKLKDAVVTNPYLPSGSEMVVPGVYLVCGQ